MLRLNIGALTGAENITLGKLLGVVREILAINNVNSVKAA